MDKNKNLEFVKICKVLLLANLLCELEDSMFYIVNWSVKDKTVNELSDS